MACLAGREASARTNPDSGCRDASHDDGRTSAAGCGPDRPIRATRRPRERDRRYRLRFRPAGGVSACASTGDVGQTRIAGRGCANRVPRALELMEEAEGTDSHGETEARRRTEFLLGHKDYQDHKVGA